MRNILSRLVQGKDLTREEMKKTMKYIMTNEASSVFTSAFLTALTIKKETSAEIEGAAEAMLEVANSIELDYDALDIVGTGGDMSYSFNISTISAVILAACGVKVCKHGNRSVSSKCGAADVLEALGANLTFPPERAKDILDKTGFVFLYAPSYHPMMKNVALIRKELGFRTIFNIMGPLINPMRPKTMLLGVYSKDLCLPICSVLKAQGLKRAMVVYGLDGVDEISASDKTHVAELCDGTIREYEFNPEDYGFSLIPHEALRGGSIEKNKEIALNILRGEQGSQRDIVVLNSACALSLSINRPVRECIEIVQEAIDSRRAYQKLNEFIEATHDIR